MTGPQFTAGAVDLAQVAKQAEAREEMKREGFVPVFTVTEADLEAKVLQRSMQIPVVVHVGSARSADSESLRATLTKLATGQRGFAYAYVDADATPQIAQALGVRIVPTTLALAAGRPLTSFEGDQSEEELKPWLEALVSNVGRQLQGLDEEPVEDAAPAEDPRLEEAARAMQAGDFDQATAIYDAMLSEEPGNKEVAQAKATVAVVKRLDPANLSVDPIADAAEHPDDVAKQLVAADAELVSGAPEKAFDRLLGLVKQSPEAKERLLELFGLFDAGDPRVLAARTKLASALF